MNDEKNPFIVGDEVEDTLGAVRHSLRRLMEILPKDDTWTELLILEGCDNALAFVEREILPLGKQNGDRKPNDDDARHRA